MCLTVWLSRHVGTMCAICVCRQALSWLRSAILSHVRRCEPWRRKRRHAALANLKKKNTCFDESSDLSIHLWMPHSRLFVLVVLWLFVLVIVLWLFVLVVIVLWLDPDALVFHVIVLWHWRVHTVEPFCWGQGTCCGVVRCRMLLVMLLVDGGCDARSHSLALGGSSGSRSCASRPVQSHDRFGGSPSQASTCPSLVAGRCDFRPQRSQAYNARGFQGFAMR